MVFRLDEKYEYRRTGLETLSLRSYCMYGMFIATPLRRLPYGVKVTEVKCVTRRLKKGTAYP